MELLYVEDDKTHLKCLNKTVDWKRKVKWCQPLLKEMFCDACGNYEENYYQEFEIDA